MYGTASTPKNVKRQRYPHCIQLVEHFEDVVFISRGEFLHFYFKEVCLAAAECVAECSEEQHWFIGFSVWLLIESVII